MNMLFIKAKEAMRNAYAPYSAFPVGVSLLSSNGRVFSGCNVENSSFPEGWCAETTALGQMILAGDTKFQEVLVLGEKRELLMPCGGCRQRLSEFAEDGAVLHLCNMDGIVDTVPFASVLPAAFRL